MTKFKAKKILLLSVVSLVTIGGVAYADHAWDNYHWGRTANPFTLEFGDNVSNVWDNALATSTIAWSNSQVLNAIIKPGNTKSRNCKPTNGRVEVCSDRYGNNGWLGIAQIWINGDHITKGIVKMNDTYFNTSTYNTSAWRNSVMCQEIGHTLGLNHQDENFNNVNLGTCMDYSSNPISNQTPNLHDYDQIEIMYSHLDSINTVFSNNDSGGRPGKGKGKPEKVGQEIEPENPSAWGKANKKDAQGKDSRFEKDLGKNDKVVTFVVWAE